jgi:amino acid transporter
MAYVFADYAVALWSLNVGNGAAWLAAGAVVLLSVVNLFGVVVGKTVQNLLTVGKLIGVLVIVVAGLVWGGDGSLQPTAAKSGPGWGLAMVFVLYTYGGWNDAAFVAAEVRGRRRNLPWVLLLGTGSILVIYLLVNLGYMWGLGFEGVRTSQAPAADVLRKALGDWGSQGISLLVMISALGAVNGMIFTGSRVYASLGADHRVFAFLGRWDPRFRAPIWSLLTSAAVALAMIFTVGTQRGRDLLDGSLTAFRLGRLPWEDFGVGFDTLVSGTAPVFWLFFLLTGLSLFVLRAKDRELERPFSVPFYPVTPIVFCLTSVYMLHSSLTYARQLALLGIVPLLLGVPLYFISRSVSASNAAAEGKET